MAALLFLFPGVLRWRRRRQGEVARQLNGAILHPQLVAARAHVLATDRDSLAWPKPFGVLDRKLGDVDAQLLVRIGRLQAQIEAAKAVRHDPEELPADHHLAVVE